MPVELPLWQYTCRVKAERHVGCAGYPGRARFCVGQCLLAVVIEGSKQHKEAHCARPKLEGPPCNVTFLKPVTTSIPQPHSSNIQSFFVLSKLLTKRSLDSSRGARQQTDSNPPVSHKGQTQWNQSSRQTLLQILTAVASTRKSSRKGGKALSHLVQLAKSRHWHCSRSQE